MNNKFESDSQPKAGGYKPLVEFDSSLNRLHVTFDHALNTEGTDLREPIQVTERRTTFVIGKGHNPALGLDHLPADLLQEVRGGLQDHIEVTKVSEPQRRLVEQGVVVIEDILAAKGEVVAEIKSKNDWLLDSARNKPNDTYYDA